MERLPRLRMATVLETQRKKLKSFVKLEEEIEEASGIKVDRRKLKKIVIGENVSMSVQDFAAVDAYLARFGESLTAKPLFEAPRILPGMIEQGSVLFVLGSFPGSEEMRADLSLWDLRALIAVKEGINDRRPDTQVNIRDVEIRSDPTDADAKRLRSELIGKSRPSVCCFGSNRASWASDLLLSEMFGVPAGGLPDRSLPFHFVWSRDLKNQIPSAFSLPPSALRDIDPSLEREVSREESRGFLVGDKAYISESERKKGRDYGVIVAQRRATGQALVVLAGLSAPMTLATARAAVDHQTGTLPAPDDAGHGLVRWALIEATVRNNRGRLDVGDVDDIRVVRSELHLVGPAGS